MPDLTGTRSSVVRKKALRWVRLEYRPNELPMSKGLQFSIRHLLLATAVVAVILGIGRARWTFMDDWAGIWEYGTFALCSIILQFVALWAAIGSGRPVHRFLVLPMAFIVGFISEFPYFYFNNLDSVIYPAMCGLQVIITAASLLVVRSCGWRLAWVDQQAVLNDPGSATAGASSTT